MGTTNHIATEIRRLYPQLPGAMCGRPYDTVIALPHTLVAGFMIELPEETGLTIEPLETENGVDCSYRVSGIPSEAGEYNVKLHFLPACGDDENIVRMELPFRISPNPRLMWRNLKVADDIEYPKPDTATAIICPPDGGMNVAAASKRGRSHAHEGSPRDDDFSISLDENSGWYVIAVADGAGSAPFSRQGSRIACGTAERFCREKLDSGSLDSAVEAYIKDNENTEVRNRVFKALYDTLCGAAFASHKAIRTEAENHGSPMKDYATTLLLAICRKFEAGWFVAGFWVGDGAICVYDPKNKAATLLGTPDEGEYAGQTRFVTMPDIFTDPTSLGRRVRYGLYPSMKALIAMTDGVSDPMFETDANLNSFVRWEEFWDKLRDGFPADGIAGAGLRRGNPSAAESLLGWLDFWSPGNHDDRTIAVVY